VENGTRDCVRFLDGREEGGKNLWIRNEEARRV
jgi:hypothetical protein